MLKRLWLRFIRIFRRSDVTVGVTVTFLLRGHGPTQETYDLLNVEDIRAWRANSKTYPQTGVVQHTERMTEKQAALFEQRRLAVSEEARLNPISLRVRAD